MKRLELKLLPPVVTLLAAGGMALTAQYLPTLTFVVPEKTALCVLLFLGGLLCELSGFLRIGNSTTFPEVFQHLPPIVNRNFPPGSSDLSWNPCLFP